MPNALFLITFLFFCFADTGRQKRGLTNCLIWIGFIGLSSWFIAMKVLYSDLYLHLPSIMYCALLCRTQTHGVHRSNTLHSGINFFTLKKGKESWGVRVEGCGHCDGTRRERVERRETMDGRILLLPKHFFKSSHPLVVIWPRPSCHATCEAVIQFRIINSLSAKNTVSLSEGCSH